MAVMTTQTAEPQDPFADEDGTSTSKQFEIAEGPIFLGQLQDEIEEALGFPVQTSLSIPDPDAQPSEDQPYVLFVAAEEEFDGRTVRGVISTHSADFPETPVPAPVEPTADSEAAQAALKRLHSGETLTTKEISVLLRGVYPAPAE
jgi:hypothetical protein